MDDDHPLPYTRAGRMLLLCSIVFACCGTWLTIYLLAESLPGGRYPILLFAMPYVLGAFLLFLGGSALLRKLGVRVRKDDTRTADGSILPAAASIALERPQTESTKTTSSAFCSNCNKEVLVDDDYRCIECHWPA